MSQDPRDATRLERFPERDTAWKTIAPGRGKGDDIHLAPWYCYLTGQNPDYPAAIIEAQWVEVARRMDRLRQDDGDPETWDVHHWQEINPVHTEALVQLTCGGPQIIYHGGLLHVRLRPFDAEARRPGLPPDVAALVHQMDADSVSVTLTNVSVVHQRRMVLQAGAFGEHLFTTVTDRRAAEPVVTPVHDRHLEVTLPPGASADLHIGMRRYQHQPRYSWPAL